MTRPLRHLILGLALASQLLLGAGKAVVFCVESDGSVQFELASVACCEPVHDLDGDAGEEVCSSDDRDCGGCVDRDLVVTDVSRAKHSLPAWSALPQIGAPVGFPPARFGPTAHVPPPTEARLGRLKSVVLRC